MSDHYLYKPQVYVIPPEPDPQKIGTRVCEIGWGESVQCTGMHVRLQLVRDCILVCVYWKNKTATH